MGVVDDSAEDPMSELWGLFKSDDDVSWQHKALCSQTDPEAFFPEKGGSTRDCETGVRPLRGARAMPAMGHRTR